LAEVPDLSKALYISPIFCYIIWKHKAGILNFVDNTRFHCFVTAHQWLIFT